MLTETLFKVIKRRSYVLGLWSKLIVAPAVSREIQNYRVFFFILIQEWGCCELILGLLRSQIGSMGPQDWAQITFR